MARADSATLLSIDRYFRIMGLSPVHAAGAAGSTFWQTRGSCPAIYQQHGWQSQSLVSRDEIAATIADVEKEMAEFLSWDLAPSWHREERYAWPNSYDPLSSRMHGDSRGGMPKLHIDRRKIISGGIRAAEKIETGVAVVHSDENADGFNETATVSFATTVTEETRVRLFFAGRDGVPEWEIRPLRSVTIVGGVATVVADSWLFIEPELWEYIPTDNQPEPIDIENPLSFVTEVDAYEVYNDNTAVSSTLIWPSGVGCDSSGPPDERVTQNGFLRIVDSNRGYVAFYPASYESDAWHYSPLTVLDRPEEVLFSYYAGNISHEYKAGRSLDPLSDYWAEAIAWMATARLPAPVCSCPNFSQRVRQLQTDLLLGNRTTGFRIFQNESVVKNNPFGWRYGEVQAWNRVQKEMQYA